MTTIARPTPVLFVLLFLEISDETSRDSLLVGVVSQKELNDYDRQTQGEMGVTINLSYKKSCICVCVCGCGCVGVCVYLLNCT